MVSCHNVPRRRLLSLLDSALCARGDSDHPYDLLDGAVFLGKSLIYGGTQDTRMLQRDQSH